MAHILIVDDDPEILSTLKDAFLMVGYTVTTALNGIMALTFYNNNNFDLAIIDVDMPVM
ncbi:MAG: response regulator, partial [Calditrichaeota bacterium]